MSLTNRILLYTGKSWVGKASVAAAAMRCAELGYRTPMLSMGTVHSLTDSFDTTLGPEPVDCHTQPMGTRV